MLMNANELADWLENHVCGKETTKEVITMLRQQQTEIEALKDALKTMCVNADSVLRKAQE
jgi:dsDNA-binding SOS-regulon protein